AADVAHSGLAAASGRVGAEAPLVARLRKVREPIVLQENADPALPADLARTFGEGSVALPLLWRGTLTGFILLGPERTSLPFGPEDLLFMATLGEQAAASIATAHMSQALPPTRAS